MKTEKTQRRDERINLRLKRSAKLTLERAAGLQGKTVSNFILGSALAQAEKTIQDQETMSLNAEESRAFVEALAQPPQFNEELLAAMEEHGRRVTSE